MARRRKRARLHDKVVKRRRALALVFIVFSLVLIRGLWIEKNRLIRVNPDQVKTIDLALVPGNNYLSIDKDKEIRWIIKKLRPITGRRKPLKGGLQSRVYFIQIYQRGKDPLEITKSGDQMAINGQWYQVKKRDLNRLEAIFSAYFKEP